MFQRIAIVGVGLLGGSLGLAIQKRKLAQEVIGIGRNAARLAAARQLRAITADTTDLRAGIAGCDLAIVCTPVERIVETVRQIAQAADRPILITDVGSTKARIVADVEQLCQTTTWPQSARFVGSHPIAGNEKSGVEHASAELFTGRAVVVTPSATTEPADTDAIVQFWTALGTHVTILPADEHDRAMAAVSHLPHLLASAIAAATPERYLALCGTGWQDTTRIAAGDAMLWRQILQSNQQHVLASLEQFLAVADEFAGALRTGDSARLEQLLGQAKALRDAVNGGPQRKPD